jgi:hypothetical protein
MLVQKCNQLVYRKILCYKNMFMFKSATVMHNCKILHFNFLIQSKKYCTVYLYNVGKHNFFPWTWTTFRIWLLLPSLITRINKHQFYSYQLGRNVFCILNKKGTVWCWIFKHSMWARNRVGIGLSYRPAAGIYSIGWQNLLLGTDSWVL